jgi:hypothetical protein
MAQQGKLTKTEQQELLDLAAQLAREDDDA